jgi:hypothetical protein
MLCQAVFGFELLVIVLSVLWSWQTSAPALATNQHSKIISLTGTTRRGSDSRAAKKIGLFGY